MRLQSTVGLVLVVATAAGQRTGAGPPGGVRSGPPTLSFGNPFTSPSVPRRFGAGVAGSWHGNQWSRRGFNPAPVLLWSGPPIDAPGFYQPAYPPNGFGQTDAYQDAPPFIAAPPARPEPTQPSNGDQPTSGVSRSYVHPENQTQTDNGNVDGETATAGNFKIETISGPQCASVGDDYHPPIIALKNHSAYSASQYWTKGRSFHFLTTQGDHYRVPIALVERIYPGSGQKTNR